MLTRAKSYILSSPADRYPGSMMPRQRHLLNPGEDGYRTPTIEDPVHPANHGVDTSSSSSHPQILSRLAEAEMQIQSRHICTGHHFGHNPYYCHDMAHRDLPEAWPDKLNWKQRIKHVTWAYFTITMATGGIANVISTGLFNRGILHLP